LEIEEGGVSFFFSDLNFDKSIVSPVDLSPDNFLYCVVTVSDSLLASSSTIFTSSLTVVLVANTAFSFFFTSSTDGFLMVVVFISFGKVDSVDSLVITTFGFTLVGCSSIFPTFLISLIFEAAVITFASSSFSFGNRRRRSFFFLFRFKFR
jgi:hypothetical protein